MYIARTASCSEIEMRQCVQVFRVVLNRKQYCSSKKNWRLNFVMELQCVFFALEYEFLNYYLCEICVSNGRPDAFKHKDNFYLSLLVFNLWAGLAGTRAQSGDWYGSGTLHSGHVLRGSLPLLSPAFRRSHFSLSDASTSPTTRALLVAKGGTGREWCAVNFAEMMPFLRQLGIFDMPQICDMGQTALLPFRRKACWEFFRPKNPTASAGSEPAILDTRGQHANH
jgi:hypothetical protein